MHPGDHAVILAAQPAVVLWRHGCSPVTQSGPKRHAAVKSLRRQVLQQRVGQRVQQVMAGPEVGCGGPDELARDEFEGGSLRTTGTSGRCPASCEATGAVGLGPGQPRSGICRGRDRARSASAAGSGRCAVRRLLPAMLGTVAYGSPSLAPRLSRAKINMCSYLVGMAGFEPAASCSQSRRANQAAPHPVEPNRSLPSHWPGPAAPPCLTGRAPRRSPCKAQPGAEGRGPGAALPGHPRAVRPRCRVTGTLSMLTRCRTHLLPGRAGVAQWQSPSLPSWS